MRLLRARADARAVGAPDERATDHAADADAECHAHHDDVGAERATVSRAEPVAERCAEPGAERPAELHAERSPDDRRAERGAVERSPVSRAVAAPTSSDSMLGIAVALALALAVNPT